MSEQNHSKYYLRLGLVLLGTPSVGWLLKTVELIEGDDLRDFRGFF